MASMHLNLGKRTVGGAYQPSYVTEQEANMTLTQRKMNAKLDPKYQQKMDPKYQPSRLDQGIKNPFDSLFTVLMLGLSALVAFLIPPALFILWFWDHHWLFMLTASFAFGGCVSMGIQALVMAIFMLAIKTTRNPIDILLSTFFTLSSCLMSCLIFRNEVLEADSKVAFDITSDTTLLSHEESVRVFIKTVGFLLLYCILVQCVFLIYKFCDQDFRMMVFRDYISELHGSLENGPLPDNETAPTHRLHPHNRQNNPILANKKMGRDDSISPAGDGKHMADGVSILIPRSPRQCVNMVSFVISVVGPIIYCPVLFLTICRSSSLGWYFWPLMSLGWGFWAGVFGFALSMFWGMHFHPELQENHPVSHGFLAVLIQCNSMLCFCVYCCWEKLFGQELKHLAHDGHVFVNVHYFVYEVFPTPYLTQFSAFVDDMKSIKTLDGGAGDDFVHSLVRTFFHLIAYWRDLLFHDSLKPDTDAVMMVLLVSVVLLAIWMRVIAKLFKKASEDLKRGDNLYMGMELQALN